MENKSVEGINEGGGEGGEGRVTVCVWMWESEGWRKGERERKIGREVVSIIKCMNKQKNKRDSEWTK